MYALPPGSGWMDSLKFYERFEHHFVKYAPSGIPLLLLLDDHLHIITQNLFGLLQKKGP